MSLHSTTAYVRTKLVLEFATHYNGRTVINICKGTAGADSATVPCGHISQFC